ncbi:MAG: winged helix-turn-helix domain-containing protein, partial [Polyangia bacterium]
DARGRLRLDAADRAPRAHLRVRAANARLLLATGAIEEARAAASATLRVVRDAPGTRARLHATAALAAAIAGASVRPPRPGDPPATYDHAQATLDLAEALLWQARATDAEALLAALADAPWPEVNARTALLRAEVAFRLGDLATAGARVTQARTAADQRGWVLYSVRAALLGAAIARTRGEDTAAETLLQDALARADACGFALEVDAARVALGRPRKPGAPSKTPGRRLAARFALDEPLRLQLRDADGRRLLGSSLAADAGTRYQLFIDFVARRVRVGKKTVDLGRRGALLDLLRALADHPGHTIAVEQLTRAVWQVDYHPLRHHSRVTMAISRLRALLGAAAIEGGTDGYRLVAENWAILEPRQREMR